MEVDYYTPNISMSLSRGYTKQLLFSLRQLLKNNITTKDDFVKFKLLVEIEMKLKTMSKSKYNNGEFNFTEPSAMAFIETINDLFFREYQKNEPLSKYKPLFDFSQELTLKREIELMNNEMEVA